LVKSLDAELAGDYRHLETFNLPDANHISVLLVQSLEYEITQLEIEQLMLSVTFEKKHPEIVANQKVLQAFYARLEELKVLEKGRTIIRQAIARELEKRIVDLEVKRINLRADYQDSHPEVIETNGLLEIYYKSLDKLYPKSTNRVNITKAIVQTIETRIVDLELMLTISHILIYLQDDYPEFDASFSKRQSIEFDRLLKNFYSNLDKFYPNSTNRLDITKAIARAVKLKISEIEERCRQIYSRLDPSSSPRQSCQKLLLALRGKLLELEKN